MNKSKPSKMNKQVLMLSFLLLTPIFLPFVLLMSHQFSRYSLGEILDFNQDKVNQTVKNMDFFLNHLKMSGINLYNDPSIQDWLNMKENDAYIQQKTIITLQNFLVTQPFISNCYLINMRTQTAYDYRNGAASFESFGDQEILKLIGNRDETWYQYFDKRIDDRSYLTLIFPNSPIAKSYYGYLVLFINKDMLRSFFMLDSKETGIETVVLNARGNVLIQSDGIAEISDLQARLSSSANGTNGRNITFQNASWIMNSATMESQGWTLHMFVRTSEINDRIQSFQYRIVFYFIVIYLLLLLVVNWSVLRSYGPLAKISEQIHQRAGKMRATKKPMMFLLRNEFAVLPAHFQSLLDDSDRVRDSMRKYHSIIKEAHLHQWILQGKLNKTMQEYLESDSRVFSYGHLYVVVIRIDSYSTFSEQYDFSSRKLMKYAMSNIASELISKESWASEYVDLGNDHIVTLIGNNDAMRPNVERVLLNIGNQIASHLKISTSIACSNPGTVQDDIRKVYDHVMEISMLKFLKGEDKIYQEEDYHKFIDMQQPLPDERQLLDIINRVRSGKGERIRDAVDQLFNHMKGLSYEACRLQLTYIMYTIMKSFSQAAPLKQVGNIESFIARYATIYDLKEWLIDIFNDLARNIHSDRISERKEEIALEIVAYVKDHLHDPNLTQDEIAIHFSLSYSYIRHIFKEVFKITLADFILSERLNLVKELLVTTDISVMEIAESAGFQSKSGFYTVFRKMFGCTPNEYRLIHK